MLRPTLILGLVLTAAAAQAQSAPTDTPPFPIDYCTALPRAVFEQWDGDYARYERWLTPALRKTQLGLSFEKDGVHTWTCQPSASPHAQLDTATVVRDAARLQGSWRIVTSRLITHIDSVTFADKRIHRTATQLPKASTGSMLVTDRKISVTETNPAIRRSGKTTNSNYELVNQRYLLLYRGAKSAGAVCQVGLDAQGRLVMHTSAVTERKVPGRYQVYQTVISQTILERQ